MKSRQSRLPGFIGLPLTRTRTRQPTLIDKRPRTEPQTRSTDHRIQSGTAVAQHLHGHAAHAAMLLCRLARGVLLETVAPLALLHASRRALRDNTPAIGL